MEYLNVPSPGIDLNCDTGEGVGNEARLLPLVSSCNIACGGHAGDPASMELVVSLALHHGVRIGAHPSYPDREHFGRHSLKLPAEVLAKALLQQVEALEVILEAQQAKLHHIKAHGALYNDLAKDTGLGETYLAAFSPYRQRAILFAPCGSRFADQARRAGFQVWEEAFADRAYRSDGSLAARQLPGAVHSEPERVWQQLRQMVFDGSVSTLDGTRFPIQAQTFCVHGDTPRAYEILAYLSEKLREESIPFAK